MFPKFTKKRLITEECEIFFVEKGKGTPVVLLHGFPQTHSMWADVAPLFPDTYHVICPDLRGYGQSSKPEGYKSYTFRNMAKDVISILKYLNVEKKAHIIGHDRGARVAYRLAIDHPELVSSVMFMDIVPTHRVFGELSASLAFSYYHWFFLSQPYPVPETMIRKDPDSFYNSCLQGWGATTKSAFSKNQIIEYRNSWRNEDCIRAMCDDYRAAYHIDQYDEANDSQSPIKVRFAAVWGKDGIMAKTFDMRKIWKSEGKLYSGIEMPGGHFFIDQFPLETFRVIDNFIKA
jgi:haloacetate dehalogenase